MWSHTELLIPMLDIPTIKQWLYMYVYYVCIVFFPGCSLAGVVVCYALDHEGAATAKHIFVFLPDYCWSGNESRVHMCMCHMYVRIAHEYLKALMDHLKTVGNTCSPF